MDKSDVTPEIQWDSSSVPVRQVALRKQNLNTCDVLQLSKLRLEQLPAHVREKLKRSDSRGQ